VGVREGLDYVRIRGVDWWPWKRRYRLLTEQAGYGAGLWVTVLPGYTWDGPTPIPVFGIFRRAMYGSVLHDATYARTKGLVVIDPPMPPRSQADDMLAELLIADGLPRWMVWLFMLPLRRWGHKWGWDFPQ